MIQILNIIAPIFLIMAAGFISVRRGLFAPGTMAPLGQFVLYIALPALIISTLSRADLQHSIEPLFLVAYGGAALCCYTGVLLVSRLLMGNSWSLSGVKAFGGSFSNSAFIGYPLLLQVFDDPPVATFAMALVFENVILMPIVLTVLESSHHESNGSLSQSLIKGTAQRVMRNPVMIAIAIGVALAALDIKLPAMVDNGLELVGKGAAGAALFFIGTALATMKVAASVADASVVGLSKLVLQPLLAAVLVMLLPPFDPALQMAAVLLSASPMLTIFPVLSGKYGQTEFASSILLTSTTAAFFSLSAVLYLLQH